MGYVLVAAVLYYLYIHGGLGALNIGSRPVRDTKIDQKMPGGWVIGIPVPSGWRVWRLPDGSQVIIQPGAATAPGGWLRGTHNGMPVWFNESTGEMR